MKIEVPSTKLYARDACWNVPKPSRWQRLKWHIGAKWRQYYSYWHVKYQTWKWRKRHVMNEYPKLAKTIGPVYPVVEPLSLNRSPFEPTPTMRFGPAPEAQSAVQPGCKRDCISSALSTT